MALYRSYGLCFDSTLALPEFLPVDAADTAAPHVHVRLGAVPETLLVPSAEGELYQINATQMRYVVPQIARYLIVKGSEIVIQPESQASEDAVRLFFSGAVVGGLLHQRAMFPLRASCIETPQGAVLIAGDSGSGKSTLAARFFQRGYRILSDNIAVIQVADDGSLRVLPEYPVLCLWDYALQRLGYGASQSFKRVRPELKKYFFPLGDSFCAHPLPLKAIYVLDTMDGEAKSEPIIGLDKMFVLNQCLYHQRFGIDMNRVETYWQIMSKIVNQVPMRRLHGALESLDSESLVEIVGARSSP